MADIVYELSKTEISELIKSALSARKFSYSPYSKFAVGSAVLCADGQIFTGCNIENSSYPVGICAERVALSKAISLGKQNFRAIVIVGSIDDNSEIEYCPPCGMCRQFLSEFCSMDFLVILARSQTEYKIFRLGDLLPETFKLNNVNSIKIKV